jgi:hypothetical protein
MIPCSSALCSGGSRFTGGGEGDVTPRSSSACDPGTAVSTLLLSGVRHSVLMVTHPVVNGVVAEAGVGADDVSGGGAASFSANRGFAAAIVNFLARESSNEVTPFAGVVLLVTTFDAAPPPPLGDTTLLLFSSSCLQSQ